MSSLTLIAVPDDREDPPGIGITHLGPVDRWMRGYSAISDWLTEHAARPIYAIGSDEPLPRDLAPDSLTFPVPDNVFDHFRATRRTVQAAAPGSR